MHTPHTKIASDNGGQYTLLTVIPFLFLDLLSLIYIDGNLLTELTTLTFLSIHFA